ncbi:MAG: helix-turn-helix domain-containing protein [Selenomonadaceae bacterium]|nr:helix-turn-helix domain-containing protein [Selenomonadaceae bacterium]MBP3723026.1 helix-turn-helix domain-containing protein [Selenomonadaceae bacterium]
MLINKVVFFASEIASMLGYSTQTVYSLIHTGKLKAFRDEGHKAWRIPESAVEDYLKTRLNGKSPVK